MSTDKKVLAFDFGASGGRAMLLGEAGGRLSCQELHRFDNIPITQNGTLYWDFYKLFDELKSGIKKAALAGGFDGIGIDTWGVDFGLVDGDGALLENPVHYRDGRTDGEIERVCKTVPAEELYTRTGIQFMSFNTLYQLTALKRTQPKLLEKAKTLLFTPDLFAYFLTGVKRAEFTAASTSQMLDIRTGDWDKTLLEKLSIPTDILPEIERSGSVRGMLKEALCKELGCKSVPVFAVCSHDTASAVAALPTAEKNAAFLSCGTWSLLGAESDTPIVSKESFAQNFTNEGGIGGTTRFLKNIMGLWIVQECRRYWLKDEPGLGFGQIMFRADNVCKDLPTIDVNDDCFAKPGDMPEIIRAYCRARGQYVPEGVGEIAACVYRSLAQKYKSEFEKLQALTGKRYGTLHLIGGGCNASLLCRLTADILGVTVKAGPSEATVIGNAVSQLLALGVFETLAAARECVANSFDIVTYEPRGGGAGEEEK